MIKKGVHIPNFSAVCLLNAHSGCMTLWKAKSFAPDKSPIKWATCSVLSHVSVPDTLLEDLLYRSHVYKEFITTSDAAKAVEFLK
jgi:hypothetical protein